MASTNFQDYNQNTPIVATWLNDVNRTVYTAAGTPKLAAQSAAAWVRFSVAGGVVTIQQSSNIATVTRTSVGLFVITYAAPLLVATNCYGLSSNLAGFQQIAGEAVGSVTVQFTNTADAATDPTSASVQIFGAN